MDKQRIVVIGAGPVGALAALYAAGRGHDVDVYELRGGTCFFIEHPHFFTQPALLDSNLIRMFLQGESCKQD